MTTPAPAGHEPEVGQETPVDDPDALDPDKPGNDGYEPV
jgi:hypothetical protein